MMQYIPEIITALGVIILGYLQYNQHTKNKMTDLKVEQIKNEDLKRNKRRSDNSMLVFGELWDLLYTMKADRVYVVQPHPLGNEEMLSIYFEVKRRGVESMRPHIQNMKICNVAKFSSDLVKKQFILITDIDKQVQDRYARSIMAAHGCKKAVVVRLSDYKHDWVGSVFCEFTDDDENEMDEKVLQDILQKSAINIQYIIPEFSE